MANARDRESLLNSASFQYLILVYDEPNKGLPLSSVKLRIEFELFCRVADMTKQLASRWKHSDSSFSWHPRDNPSRLQKQIAVSISCGVRLE